PPGYGDATSRKAAGHRRRICRTPGARASPPAGSALSGTRSARSGAGSSPGRAHRGLERGPADPGRRPPAGLPPLARPGSPAARARSAAPALGAPGSRREPEVADDEHERVVVLLAPAREDVIRQPWGRLPLRETGVGGVDPDYVGCEGPCIARCVRNDIHADGTRVPSDASAPD